MNRTDSAIDYCADQVRLYDHERFLTTLFMPYAVRPALWALYAFHIEIAKTASIVSDRMTGLLRLQWWHEAIERLYQGKPDAHEVIRGLEIALQNGAPWQEADFKKLIETYEDSLENGEKPMPVILLLMACQAAGERAQAQDIEIIARAYTLQENRPVIDAKKLPHTLRLYYLLCGMKKDYLLPLRLWLGNLFSGISPTR